MLLSNYITNECWASPKPTRVRVNTYRQRGSMSAVIRVVSFGIPNWKDMDIPEEVMKIASLSDGPLLLHGDLFARYQEQVRRLFLHGPL